MIVRHFEIEGPLLLEPNRFGDHRGLFCEVFKARDFTELGLSLSFIQDNIARSSKRGVVRGLHMQRAPFAQDKLIRCARGHILDVAVDVREASPTFGKSIAVELTADNWLQLLVPAGFAHGYLTLEDNCEVHYKVTAPYKPEAEEGLLWSDPALGIDWPIGASRAIVNERDAAWPTLRQWSATKGFNQ